MKMYKQPSTEVAAMRPTTIICASITNGGGTDNLTPPGGGDIDND